MTNVTWKIKLTLMYSSTGFVEWMSGISQIRVGRQIKQILTSNLTLSSLPRNHNQTLPGHQCAYTLCTTCACPTSTTRSASRARTAFRACCYCHTGSSPCAWHRQHCAPRSSAVASRNRASSEVHPSPQGSKLAQPGLGLQLMYVRCTVTARLALDPDLTSVSRSCNFCYRLCCSVLVFLGGTSERTETLHPHLVLFA